MTWCLRLPVKARRKWVDTFSTWHRILLASSLSVCTRNLANRFAARSSVTCSLTLVYTMCIICVTLHVARQGVRQRRQHDQLGLRRVWWHGCVGTLMGPC